MSKQIEFEGQTHEFPDDFTDADIAKALGGGSAAPAAAPQPPPETALGKVTRIAGEEAAKTPGRVVEGIKNLVSGGAEALQNPKLGTILPLALTGGSSTIAIPGIRAALDNPATTSIVTRLGSLAAGKMMDQPSESPTENLKTAVKGVTGYDVSKPFDWRQALSAVTSPAAMEAVFPAASAVGSKAYRSTGAGRQAINAADAERVGETIGNISPPLAGSTTAGELRTAAAGPGRRALGAAKEDIVQQIEQATPTVMVPSLGPNPIPFREANQQMSEIGARAFSRNPLDRTVLGVDQRRLYGQVSNDIEAALPANMRPLWRQAQEDYSRGLATLKPLEGAKAWKSTPGEGSELNMPYLQRYVADPRNEARLRGKLGNNGYDELVNSLMRGAPLGSADVMSSRPLGLMETAGSGGMAARLFRLAAKAFPNASSRYVGQVPYNYRPGPAEQTIADVLAAGAQR